MSRRQDKRTFGEISPLPSGRYRARYRGPDGDRYTAPVTFLSRMDAETWLSAQDRKISSSRRSLSSCFPVFVAPIRPYSTASRPATACPPSPRPSTPSRSPRPHCSCSVARTMSWALKTAGPSAITTRAPATLSWTQPVITRISSVQPHRRLDQRLAAAHGCTVTPQPCRGRDGAAGASRPSGEAQDRFSASTLCRDRTVLNAKQPRPDARGLAMLGPRSGLGIRPGGAAWTTPMCWLLEPAWLA